MATITDSEQPKVEDIYIPAPIGSMEALREGLMKSIEKLDIPCGCDQSERTISVTYDDSVIFTCYSCNQMYQCEYSMNADGEIIMGDPVAVEAHTVFVPMAVDGMELDDTRMEPTDKESVPEIENVIQLTETETVPVVVVTEAEVVPVVEVVAQEIEAETVDVVETNAETVPESVEAVESIDQKQTFDENWGTHPVTFTERWDGTQNTTLKINGICGKINEVTANGRVYPTEVWNANKQPLAESLTIGKFLGESDHPDDGRARVKYTCVKFNEIFLTDQAGNVVESAVDNNPCFINYRAEVIPTRHDGENLIMLIQHGVGVEWSSRGRGTATVGEWNGEKDVEILNDDYRYAAFDAVIGAATADTGVAKFEQSEMENNIMEQEIVQAPEVVVAEQIPTPFVDEATVAKFNKLIAKEKASELLDASDLGDKAKKILGQQLAACVTEQEVQDRFNSLYETAKSITDEKPVTEDKQHLSAGVYEGLRFQMRIPEKDQMRIPGIDEVVERPETVIGVIETMCKGLKGSKEERYSDYWNFRKLMMNMAGETTMEGNWVPNRKYGAYLHNMTKEGFGRWTDRQMESTATSDVADGNPFLIPIFRSVYPRLIATQLVTTQAIDKPDAKVFFLKSLRDPAGTDTADSTYFDSTYANHTESAAKAKNKLSITSASISVTEKALEFSWTSQLEQDLMAYHNLDAGEELLNMAGDEIAREINFEILEDIRSQAGNSFTYGTALPTAWTGGTGGSVADWRKELFNYVLKASATVANKKYVPCNWIVGDALSVGRLQYDQPFTSVQPGAEDQMAGIVYAGVYANMFKVYTVPSSFFAASTLLLGNKPTRWDETSYIFAPYIAQYITPRDTNTSTNTTSQAIGSRYAKYLVSADYFAIVQITAAAGTVLV